MMKTALAARSEGLRKAAYRDVGLHLQELRHKRDQAELATVLWQECRLPLPRAYQLLAQATRTKRRDRLPSDDRAPDAKLKATLAESLHQEQRRAHG
jgi:hypothetical protein